MSEDKCTICKGTGSQWIGEHPGEYEVMCETCHGTGHAPDELTPGYALDDKDKQIARLTDQLKVAEGIIAQNEKTKLAYAAYLAGEGK